MHPVPAKKTKSVALNTKKSEKHVCLQCMELHLQGKRDERFTSICRLDSSSIKRHKERWHNLPNSEPCTFVPSTAPDIAIIVDKYAQIKQRKEAKGSCHTKLLSVLQPLPIDEENPINENDDEENTIDENDDVSEIECQGLQEPEKINEHSDSNPSDPFNDDLSADSFSQKSSLLAKNQKTLLEFTKPNTSVLEKDKSLKQVIDAVAELSLKVENIGKQHTSFLQLAFEDKDVGRSVSAMRKAENILELTESTQLLEWFYDEDTE